MTSHPPQVPWVGLFNTRLHRVDPANATRLQARGMRFGLSDCGVACVPRRAAATTGTCSRCYPDTGPHDPPHGPHGGRGPATGRRDRPGDAGPYTANAGTLPPEPPDPGSVPAPIRRYTFDSAVFTHRPTS